jgi:hypothetical protein
LPRYSIFLVLAVAACAGPREASPPAKASGGEPRALAALPATFRNTPSCPGCLALTLTLRPDGSFVARERLGSSEFYDFGRWREARGEGLLHLAGSRDGLRRYAIKTPDLLDSQEGTQGGDLKRVAEVEALRGPFRLMGTFDGRVFKECHTGLSWPLDDSRAAQALKEQFSGRRQPMLVSLDGRFEQQGRAEALRVVRTAAVHNERGCPG